MFWYKHIAKLSHRCIFLRDSKNILQAVIVAENGISYSWLRKSEEAITGWALTQNAVRVVRCDEHRDGGGIVRWDGTTRVQEQAFDLGYAHGTPFDLYLRVFDAENVEAKQMEIFDRIKVKQTELKAQRAAEMAQLDESE